MVSRPSVLCPIDFSDACRSALRFATAIAEHFAARLTLLTVNDPLLADAADMRIGPTWLRDDSERELRRFFERVVERAPSDVEIDFEVAIGKPAPEILRVARERHTDLIVMSTHGVTGVRKLFFGATTERVLRETTIPVLVTPVPDPGPLAIERVKPLVRRVLVPVDLSSATARQVQVARGLAAALDVPVLLAHVIEPARFPSATPAPLPSVNAERRARADQALEALISTLPSQLKPEGLVAYGDPAEEIAKIVRERDAGLIVIGLHSPSHAGPRMGSVTYRILCLTATLVLALPPGGAAAHPPAADRQAHNG
jgi:nucleotide-binding universal stress UspA family protein